MRKNSSLVTSNQTGIHQELESIVKKHLFNPFKKPYQRFNQNLFNQLNKIVNSVDLSIILDSGCGTGESSLFLAKQHPDNLIIGIDKSEKRLNKIKKGTDIYHNDNVILARGDVIDIWRLAEEAKWNIKKHYLLYPNPWPKKNQLKKRWHGHPVFQDIIKLCDHIEMRTNWKIYGEEFKQALSIVTNNNIIISTIEINEFISPFEKKYYESGHKLYKVVLNKSD